MLPRPPSPLEPATPQASPEPQPVVGQAQLWLVRAPAVGAQKVGIPGDADIAPTTQTWPRLLERYEALPFDSVHSSPLRRAREFAAALAAAKDLEARVDERLRAAHLGAWQGLDVSHFEERWQAQAQAFWSAPDAWCPPDAESPRAVAERAWQAFAEIARAPGTHLVVSHASIIRALVARALGIPHAASLRMHVDPAHATLITASARGWNLERSNAASPSRARVGDDPLPDEATEAE